MLNLEEFRSNDCLFQLKIMGIVFRRGIPVHHKAIIHGLIRVNPHSSAYYISFCSVE